MPNESVKKKLTNSLTAVRVVVIVVAIGFVATATDAVRICSSFRRDRRRQRAGHLQHHRGGQQQPRRRRSHPERSTVGLCGSRLTTILSKWGAKGLNNIMCNYCCTDELPVCTLRGENDSRASAFLYNCVPSAVFCFAVSFYNFFFIFCAHTHTHTHTHTQLFGRILHPHSHSRDRARGATFGRIAIRKPLILLPIYVYKRVHYVLILLLSLTLFFFSLDVSLLLLF